MPGGRACRVEAPSSARDEIVDAPRAARGGLGLRGVVQAVMREKGVESMMGGSVWRWRCVEVEVGMWKSVCG